MPYSIPFISLKDIHAPYEQQLRESVRRVIDSGVYINGPENRAFESEIADRLGLSHVVGVSNGLDAIRLILRGYIETGRLKPGDEVIVPSNTYIASVLPVVEFGLKPLLVAPDLSTYGLDWREAEAAMTDGTKAVMTVHLYGTPSWDFDVARRMRERGALILEDNAQAIGARITDPATGDAYYTGSLGDAAAFSFYPTKNIGALGDAGAVATADARLAETVKSLANYGSTVRYHNDYVGYNCRMDELQAAVLRVKLQHLDAVTERRARMATLYGTLINAEDVQLPETHPDMTQVWHQYMVRSPRRDEIRQALAEAGIPTDIHYPVALTDQKCFRAAPLPAYGEAETVARRLAGEVLSLPIATVSETDISTISNIINGLECKTN